MLIAPAAAARQWTDRLGLGMALAAVFGALAGVIGRCVSAETERLPTGPTIVLCVTAIVLVSLLAAPRRGLVWRELRRRRDRRRLRLAAVLGRPARARAPAPGVAARPLGRRALR